MREREKARPKCYYYFEQLKEHLGGERGLSKIFNGKPTWPRQLEIHLPGDHIRPCNFNCLYCAGLKFQKDLGTFEIKGLELLRQLNGRIPYVIYGGSYTEPLLNPYFMSYLAMTKATGAHFGIHTNGSLLKRLEEEQGWLSELVRIAEDEKDYLSVSLDAGCTESHCETKKTKYDWFSEIIEGIRMAVEARKAKKGPAVRVCYLMNKFNSSEEKIENIVRIMQKIKPNSLRFSIPFAHYAQEFGRVRRYKKNVENRFDSIYYERVKLYLSKDRSDRPFIFYISPEFQDVDLFDFKQCAYGYYQICWGADGYVYRCTTISSPSFKHLRLGKLPKDLKTLSEMILRNQTPKFDANICFSSGGRCNRMGLEINRSWREYINSKK